MSNSFIFVSIFIMQHLNRNKHTSYKGDPSSVSQTFSTINLQILCCRYWWLENWEFDELSFPYWRIYHNTNEMASIDFGDDTYKLTEDKIAVIAPRTAYATRIIPHAIPPNGVLFKGGKITQPPNIEQIIKNHQVLHLFIHFNLGSIYDKVKPGVFLLDANTKTLHKLALIKDYLIKSGASMDMRITLEIKSLIYSILTDIPTKIWELPTHDNRILDTVQYIENNPSKNLCNRVLADKIGLTPTSFHRLFTKEVGVPPQKFVKQSRVDQACILLHHSMKTIDAIAAICGFADRYHFSRIFKQVSGTSPARYRSHFKMR